MNQPRSILLVDDEPIIITSARRILEKKGYTVFTAESGASALALYQEKQEEVDVILLDLSMPDMDGEETLEKLIDIDADAKVVLFSGYARSGDLEPLFEKGAADHVQKPFDIKTLIKTIDRVIG